MLGYATVHGMQGVGDRIRAWHAMHGPLLSPCTALHCPLMRPPAAHLACLAPPLPDFYIFPRTLSKCSLPSP